MLNIREPMMDRTRLHHHRLVREIGEAGKDEDDEAEAEELVRMLEYSRLQVQAKVQDKDKDR